MKQLVKQFVLPGFAFLACLVLLSGNSNAAGLEYYGIEDAINNDQSVHNTIVLKFKEPVARLDYSLGFKIYNFTAKSDFPLADCDSADTASGSLISCDFIGMTTKTNQLTLDFDTNDVIDKIDSNYKFAVNYGVSLPIDRVFALIKMPENGILAEMVANQSYYPQDGSIMTDGRRIMLYWEKTNVTDSSDLQFSVLYTMPGSRGPLFNYIIVFLTAVVIVVMIAVVVYMKRGSRGAKPEEVIQSVLNKDEKAVVDVLNRHEGKVVQKAIARESGFSKAKVSRLVRNLKERGVVIVEPVSGRENRIILDTGKKE